MFAKYIVTLEEKEGNPDPKEGQVAVVKRLTIVAGSASDAAKKAGKLGKVLKIEAK